MTAKEIGEQRAFAYSGSAPGMTYRQWLVGMALSGFTSRATKGEQFSILADDAVKQADAVLAELAKVSLPFDPRQGVPQ